MENLIDKVKKSDSFQTPDGYFSTLPDRVMAKIEKEEEVGRLMDKYREGQSFQVPDGYFSALPDKVMGRIKAGEKSRFLFRRRLITAISVAASLVLVLGIGLLWNNMQGDAVSSSDRMTAEVVEPQPATPSVFVEHKIPENSLAQATVPETKTTPVSSPKRVVNQSENDLLIEKADAFVDDYAIEELDEIDYEMLDYFSEEDYITMFMES